MYYLRCDEYNHGIRQLFAEFDVILLCLYDTFRLRHLLKLKTGFLDTFSFHVSYYNTPYTYIILLCVIHSFWFFFL